MKSLTLLELVVGGLVATSGFTRAADFHRYECKIQSHPAVCDSIPESLGRLTNGHLDPVRHRRDLDEGCQLALEISGVGEFADWDQPYNGGCVRDPNQPNSQLIVAACGQAGGYVLLVRGGFMSSYDFVVYWISNGQVSLVALIPLNPAARAAREIFRSRHEEDARQLQQYVVTFFRSRPAPTLLFVRE